jgi:4-amino-4-deoxy-L-arabinose transferase-like glycosyltransferase
MTCPEKLQQHKWLIGILAIASFLRFYHIGFQSAWLDEVHTLKESDPILSLSEFHQTIMFREGIPHFYFLIVRAFSEVFGSNIVSARTPSALAGITTVLVVYLLGKELYGKRAGIIAALLLTVNVFHVEYSQEARSYALLALLTATAFYFLLRFLKEINLKNALLLGFFAGLITNAQPIGLVSAGAIYIVVFVFLLTGDKTRSLKLLGYSFLAGIVSLVVFSPVLQIVMKVSEIKNMWIPAPTFESIIQVFVLLSGRSMIMLLASMIGLVVLLVLGIKHRGASAGLLQNKPLLAFVILFTWIFASAAVIIGKSYMGESIVLHRYFLGILPALALAAALGIAALPKKPSIALSAVAVVVLLYPMFSPVPYYSTIYKSQYDKVCAQVLQKNGSRDKVVSNWGWLMSYYLNHDNKNKPVIEMPLERYAEDLKNGAGSMGSFWYVDGNSRPYALNADLENYLKANFIIDQKIEMTDAWAYHFKITNIDTSNLVLDLTEFEAAMFDGSGAMIFVENKTTKYPSIPIQKGIYTLIVKGVSLPEKPINGENAHFNVIIDGIKTGEFFLSEKAGASGSETTFEVSSDKEISLQLQYDNDIVVGADDRNAIVTMIKIVKK